MPTAHRRPTQSRASHQWPPTFSRGLDRVTLHVETIVKGGYGGLDLKHLHRPVFKKIQLPVYGTVLKNIRLLRGGACLVERGMKGWAFES